jgi:hypothetical protein
VEVVFSWFFFYWFVVARGCDRCFAVFEMAQVMLKKKKMRTKKGLTLVGL